MTAINAVTDLSRDGEIAILTLDSPPVNALSLTVRAGLFEGFKAALASDARAVLLICDGTTFIAGADISNLSDMLKEPSIEDIQKLMDGADRPVVAAIHGAALGGGLEIALCAHFRLAVPSARLGFPEINLGLLPGAGGTQRLPRVAGPQKALDMMTSGKPIRAQEALELGLIDQLAPEGSLREGAIAFARQALADGRRLVRIRDRDDKVESFRGKPELLEPVRKELAAKFRGQVAPGWILDCVEAAVEKPFDEGIALEKQRFFQAAMSPQSAARRYYFFAERNAQKVPDAPEETKAREVKRVGVVGAGAMGGGIAMNFANIGVPVTLVEMKQEALDHGLSVIRGNYERSRGAGPEETEKRMALLAGALDMAALADCDLVIEAVFENLDVKKDVFRKLDQACKPEAILASNTSFLNLDEIAAATGRPGQVIGLHFFSPAQVMPLLEVVRGEATSAETLLTALELGKRIRKTTVVSRVGPGFIANRVASPRLAETNTFLLEGLSPARVDKVIYDFGFPMGPFATLDLVGLDVIPDPPGQTTVRAAMVAAGRRGQKGGGGFYDYDDKRNPVPSAAADQVIAAYRQAQGGKTLEVSDEEILERSLYLEANEGAKVLEEGIAQRASDIDVAMINGFGWPVDRGGPMYYADQLGLEKVVARLREFEARYGPQYKPAPLLERLAAEGKKLTAKG
ncbi:MAG TPA: 3-hydroxyacyl-CoA dehydrogenase NAD-binding domain-containing protein [Phenylobacterium sp.]|uniref:3-hydroxyacyl-CoA dehydrogenase NAD-binding domain-containing protein n=1 Tax=Phenylobacterium sp. TaxID=1871053 RepID=UPI002B481876|nr:3-hydroxyacyl-CoA dehydrogenase NAD-binding domain-containing protein [Phenylobacterium sp.]HKR88995.1 3-hydroxyacyl-CoA dehydrogenase NAD-binding domain-containing protein [Phenylobacterium sp.]